MIRAGPDRPTGVERSRNRAVVVLRRHGTELIRWGVPADERPDLDLIDELARVAVAAKRVEATLALHVFCPRLASVIDLVGLRDALDARGPAVLLAELDE